MKSLLLIRVLFVVLLASYSVVGECSSNDSLVKSESGLIVKAVPPRQDDFNTCSQATIDGNALGLDFQYEGRKALRGYLIAIYHQGGGAKQYQTDRRLVGPGEPMILPGTKWHSTACGLPAGAGISNVRVNVDLVVFGDESTSGPVELRDSSHLYGVIEGMAFVSGKSTVKRFVTPLPLSAAPDGNPIPDDGKALPLKFTGLVRRSRPNEGTITIDATNVGTVPVSGFVFRLSFFDHASGVFLRSVTTKALATSGKVSEYLQPDASWRVATRKLPVSSDGAFDSYTIAVDSIVLADGTVLSPHFSSESEELLGMLEGVTIAKSMPPTSR